MKKQKHHTEFLQLRIDPTIKAKLARMARKQKRSMSEMVRVLVEDAA